MPKDYKFCLLKNEFGDVKGNRSTFNEKHSLISSFPKQLSPIAKHLLRPLGARLTTLSISLSQLKQTNANSRLTDRKAQQYRCPGND